MMGDAQFWQSLVFNAYLVPLMMAGVSGLVLFRRLPLGLLF